MAWSDNPEGLYTNVPVLGQVDIGDAANPLNALYVRTLTATTVNATTIDLSGLSINYNLSVYAAGTAYTMTASAAVLTFGTTSPTLVLDKAGTYLITAKANLENVGATFAANRDVTLKLTRTNNTPGDLAHSTTVFGTGVTTTVTGLLALAGLPAVIYTTTNTTDSISIEGLVSVVPTAGSLQVTEASIVAIRLY